MLILLALALVIAVLACVFALQNAHTVTLTFLTLKWQASMALVLLATFAVGSLVAFLASLPTFIKSKLDVADLKRKLAKGKIPSPDAPPPSSSSSDRA